jgi:Na+-translocating ferredoxin:NAD+ oxidoreductase RnfC subunit
MPHNSGMDWIRLQKRMAIYHRDGFDCVWCRSVFPINELGHGLELDHVHREGGNEAYNLVTCCHTCNSVRQTMPMMIWLDKLARENNETPQEVAYRVLVALGTPLNMKEGKRLAELRRPKKEKKEERHLRAVGESEG